jgi:hypothetical protein
MRADDSDNIVVAPNRTKLFEDTLVNHKSFLWIIIPFR